MSMTFRLYGNFIEYVDWNFFIGFRSNFLQNSFENTNTSEMFYHCFVATIFNSLREENNIYNLLPL